MEPGSDLRQVQDRLTGTLQHPGVMTDSALGVPVVFEPTSEAKASRVATLSRLALVSAMTPNQGELAAVAARLRETLARDAPESKIRSRPTFLGQESLYIEEQKQKWASFRERQLRRLAAGESMESPYQQTVVVGPDGSQQVRDRSGVVLRAGDASQESESSEQFPDFMRLPGDEERQLLQELCNEELRMRWHLCLAGARHEVAAALRSRAGTVGSWTEDDGRWEVAREFFEGTVFGDKLGAGMTSESGAISEVHLDRIISEDREEVEQLGDVRAQMASMSGPDLLEVDMDEWMGMMRTEFRRAVSEAAASGGNGAAGGTPELLTQIQDEVGVQAAAERLFGLAGAASPESRRATAARVAEHVGEQMQQNGKSPDAAVASLAQNGVGGPEVHEVGRLLLGVSQ